MPTQEYSKSRSISLLLLIILLVEVILIYHTASLLYVGVYRPTFFFGLFGAQVPLVFMNRSGYKSLYEAYSVQVIIILIVPLVFFFTKPEYTYDQGMQDVLSAYSLNTQGVLLPAYKCIPVKQDVGGIGIADYMYYYIVESECQHVVLFHPVTGDMIELDKAF